jgi:ribonuclease E
MVGKKVKVRIERVLDGVAYGSLLTQPGKQAVTVAPVTAELEAVKPTRQPRRRKPAGAEKDDPAVEETAEEDVTAMVEEAETETEAEDATATADGSDPDKPKRKTRRGSRGGRRRRKPAIAAATTSSDGDATAPSDGEGNGQVGARIHIPEPDLGQDEPEVVAEVEEPSQNGAQGEETPKPRKRTRRGSRGGRNRRKKPAATTEKTADS